MIIPRHKYTEAVKQVRRVFKDNLEIIFVILHKNIYCGYSLESPRNICSGYSLESPRRGDSNEYPQYMFLWRTIENYPSIITKYPPYLFHCEEGTAKLTKICVYGKNSDHAVQPHSLISLCKALGPWLPVQTTVKGTQADLSLVTL